MTQFDPASLLVSRSQSADEGPIIRMSQRARELRAGGMDVVSLTLGEPDFDTPENIQAAATAAMKAGLTHYSPVMGIPELRNALSAKLRVENGLDYGPNDICVSNGAKQAIANAILSIVGDGDEVIMLAPFWVSYEITVRFAGGTPKVLHAGVEENYKVPASRIAAAISPRTKLIVLNSPSNPTGAVWTRGELMELAEVVKSHPHLMVLSDEIYEYIMFGGEMVSIGSLPGMRERTITVNGFSKGFAMTGWRLGYAAAPAPIAKAMGRMQSALTAGANQFVQRAAIAALEGPRGEVERMRQEYQKRRDMVLAGLRAIPGLRIGDIPATFYAFPDVSGLLGRKAGNHVIDTTDALCDWLLEQHGVATVPGTAFGAPGSIRLSFACSETEIAKAMQRMQKALGEMG
jgi:aspartate aminotransferase